MTRDDDPEVRIRELERALSEQARTSELTAPTGRPPEASAARRLLFVAIAVAVLAVPVAAAVAFAGHFFGRERAASAPAGNGHRSAAPISAPPPSQGGAHSDQSVVVNGTTVLTGPGLVQLPDLSDDPGLPIQIAGVRGSRTLACDDRPVTISGVSNNVVITGHCTTVNVSGIDNTVAVDSADQIATSGMQNRVTYHSGTPDIPDPGESNTVRRG